MFRISVPKVKQDQKGITGLETAIILIAFVVLAAVFSYTVLSAGLFASQKSKEAIYTSLDQTQSTTEVKGAVVALAEAGNLGAAGYVSQLSFTLANALGGSSIDFTPPGADVGNDGKADEVAPTNKVVISYIDQNQKVNDLYWTLTKLGSSNADDLLDAGEKFQITIGNAVHSAAGGNLADALGVRLGPNTTFTIEVVTPTGSTLTLERTTGAVITAAMNLN
jgi:flagellin FlaB